MDKVKQPPRTPPAQMPERLIQIIWSQRWSISLVLIVPYLITLGCGIFHVFFKNNLNGQAAMLLGIVLFYPHISVLLTVLALRVLFASEIVGKYGDKEIIIRTLKEAPVDETLLPKPSSEQEITVKDLALLSSCRREEGTNKFKQLDQQYHQRVYQIEIVVAASQAVMKRIDSVRYIMPDEWERQGGKKEYLMTTSANRFRLRELTWADVLVPAEVRIKDGPTLLLSCFVKLDEHGPRL